MQIRLLGGFDVRGSGGTAVRFESQKVRALLAYLVAQEGRRFSRDQVGALLWPEADAESSRRNLRQALYNLRQSLPELNGALEVSPQSVGFHVHAGDHVDVVDLLAALRDGLPGGDEVLVAPLRRAVDLYRGDLLAGFHVRDSVVFEEWQIAAQERLREAVLEALRALIDHFAARGEYDEALTHARRRVEIDPLSEDGHRDLMRLYVLAGRRRRALSQFEDLAELLAREMATEPLPETRALYERIRVEDLPLDETAPRLSPAHRPLGPFVPLVGRAPELAALEESWSLASGGAARLMLVEGPPGIGKTRLVKTFLDSLSSRQKARVIQGRCPGGTVRIAGQPFLDLLHELDGSLAASVDAEAATGAPGPEPVPADLTATLDARIGSLSRPLVLYLDDFQSAADSDWRRLERILDLCAERALWLLVAADGVSTRHRRLDDHPRVDRLQLGRLGATDVTEIARRLLREHTPIEGLGAALHAASGGHPLAVVEQVNSLCEDGILVPAGRNRWTLDTDPTGAPSIALDLDRVIERRIERLPSSTRRLLVLAAVIGQTFDVELLQRAAREHMGVVEIGLELLLERWLIRQYARRWTESPRERDLTLWAQGARRGSFEFAHAHIRQLALAQLSPGRRRQLHREVAEALAARAEDGVETPPEVLAHHLLAAGDDEAAAPHLAAAAERARRLGDEEAGGELVADGVAASHAVGEGDQKRKRSPR